jgi:hypothetical protein
MLGDQRIIDPKLRRLYHYQTTVKRIWGFNLYKSSSECILQALSINEEDWTLDLVDQNLIFCFDS